MCPRATCSGDETNRHVMWDCPFAGVVWARAEGLLGRVVRGFHVTWARVERGVWASGGRRNRFLLWLIISLFKRVLWQGRKEWVLRGVD